MTPRTVTVDSLIGKNIRGLKAITMQPEDYPPAPEQPPTQELLRAERKRKGGFEWVYLYWIPQSGTCGYSGWREDVTPRPVVTFVDGDR